MTHMKTKLECYNYVSHYETKAEKEPGNEATSMKNFNLPGREGCQELDLAL